jgi:hypothetical protein
MGRHNATVSRMGIAAAGAAVLATAASAFVPLPGAHAEPLTLTITGPAAPAYTCDLQSPPEFGDPANPDTITNRACSYVDDQGRQRSFDPWIDGQLLHASR